MTQISPANTNPLIQKANELVNTVFWGTMLREFREASETTMFDGGSAGATFTRQLDLELIKRISERGSSPIADMLAKKLDKYGKYNLDLVQKDAQKQITREIINDRAGNTTY